jgi:hypothetical protein
MAFSAWHHRERLTYALFPAKAVGGAVTDARDEVTRARHAVQDLHGFVVWSSNRYGNHDILKMSLPDMSISRLTTHPHAEFFPRISPDGRSIVFARSRQPRVSQRDQVPWDVILLDLTSGSERRIAEYATTPTWSDDGRRIFFLRGSESALYRFDLAVGSETLIFRSGTPPLPRGVALFEPDMNPNRDQIAVTFRGAERTTALVSHSRGVERIGDGCQMAWSPDASFLYWIDQGGRQQNQVVRQDVATGARRIWLDLPEPFSHEYFPRMSRESRFLVLGASAGGHEHDLADYEIFLWRIGMPAEQAVRLTYHSGNDNWPDIFLRAD